jgi:nucleotide-binding universal stress UspA family protein
MKLLLAADGSKLTKKALAFLVTHESLAGPEDELVVLHVQPRVPPRVSTLLGTGVVAAYHREEADKVLDPIKRFLSRHALVCSYDWTVGSPADEIVRAAKKQKCHMIVMGTHGHGLLGRALMGSVAQRVVTESEVPVLLVK